MYNETIKNVYKYRNEVYMSQSIPFSTVLWLSLATILLLAVPVIYFILIKKKATIIPSALLLGIPGFFVFSSLLESIPHYFCIISSNPVSKFITGNTIAYMIYGGMMAGIFEECGRYVIYRFLLKKSPYRETSLSYGLGHGGFEVLIVSFAQIVSLFVFALMGYFLGIDQAYTVMGLSTEATRATGDVLLSTVLSYNGSLAICAVLERVIVVPFHIAMSVIVFYSVRKKKISYLFLAIALHATLDFPAALYQRGSVPLWILEGYLLVFTVACCLLAYRLYCKMDGLTAKQTKAPADVTVDAE